MSDLITRLRGLTGPSREVDLDIAIALEIVPREVAKYGPHLRRLEARRVDPYTASLDASIELCGRVLPGWGWSIESDGFAQIWLHGRKDETTILSECALPLPPIALLIALLRAKEARDAKAE